MQPHGIASLAAQTSAVAARRSCRPAEVSVFVRATTTTTTSAASAPALLRRLAHPSAQRRSYATHHQTASSSSSMPASARRRSVTPFNDDGHVPWSQLSAGEKTGRAAQQTFNLGLILVGAAVTSGIVYLLYTEVFSPESKVAYFNRAVNRIRADPRCTELLGDGSTISAFGQETWNKWQRARPIASTIQSDSQSREHIVMHFNVKGERATGTAYLHLIRPPGQDEFVYQSFYVDIPGQERIYLEKHKGVDPADGKKTTLFGVKWR